MLVPAKRRERVFGGQTSGLGNLKSIARVSNFNPRRKRNPFLCMLALPFFEWSYMTGTLILSGIHDQQSQSQFQLLQLVGGHVREKR